MYSLVNYIYNLARRSKMLRIILRPETVAMRLIYLIIIILYLSNKLNAQYIGSTCTLENGLRGTCVPIINCPSVGASVRDRKTPQLCEFLAEDPIVCCPENEVKQSKFDRPECAISINLSLTDDVPERIGHASLKVVDAPHRLRVERATQALNSRPDIDRHNIAGGLRAAISEFPHMVRLGIGENESNIEWFCGGSLISNKYILTAAHCVYSRFGTINWALVGDPASRFLPRNVQIINNIRHPNFNYSQHYHDIALSEMKDRISFRANIQPACLYIQQEIPNYLPITVTGWGSTEYGGEGSENLLKADVSLFTHQECSQKYSNSLKKLQKGIDKETQFCAGGRTEVKDTCQGDSGGPIQLKTTNRYHKRIYAIIGVTSFGKICGFVNQPGVYVRIYPYLGWIESIVFNSTIV